MSRLQPLVKSTHPSKKLLLGAGLSILTLFIFLFYVFSAHFSSEKTTATDADAKPPLLPLNADSPESPKKQGPFINLFVEVQNEDGIPIAAAKVSVKGRIGLAAAFDKTLIAQEEGLAVFEKIPAALHEVTISAKGYASASFPPPQLPESAKDASVVFVLERKNTAPHKPQHNRHSISEEDEKHTPEFTAPPLNISFSGAVLSDGQPAQGAQVLRLRKDPLKMEPTDLALCDKNGRFFFKPAPLADQKNPVVSVVAFHKQFGRGELNSTAFTSNSKTGIEVLLSLPKGAFLEGIVLDAAGQPQPTFTLFAKPHFIYASRSLRQAMRLLQHLPKAERRKAGVKRAIKVFNDMKKGVRLFVKPPIDKEKNTANSEHNLEQDEQHSESQFPKAGTFRIGPIAAGVVTLAAIADEYAPVELELELDEGETFSNIRLKLQAPLYVSGQVTDAETDAPLKGARVRARMTKGTHIPGFGVARSDAEGFFQIRTQAGVRHTIEISKRGYTPFEQGGFSGSRNDERVLDVKLRRARGKQKGRRAPRDYVGIGAQLRLKRDVGIVVQKIFAGGAAAEHLQKGDVIVAVDREDVEGSGLLDVVQLILGEPDTEVELTILPKGQRPEQNIVLLRKRVSTGK